MSELSQISTCDLADALPAEQFVNPAIRALWPSCPRLHGPAFTVFCPPGDHLMLHAAIYLARPGDIIVVKGDDTLAMAGGNVCAIAQQNGVAGFIIDGYVRDIAEIRQMKFPVYAKGTFPKPAVKKRLGSLQQTINCGGVTVHNADTVVADEDGIAVIPHACCDKSLVIAQHRLQSDQCVTLAQWRTAHLEKVQSTLSELGFNFQQ